MICTEIFLSRADKSVDFSKAVKNIFKNGYSLIELLTVIAIMGILATIILVALNSAKEEAKISKARTELSQIRNSIEIMSMDVNEWPGHQPVDRICTGSCDTNEIALNASTTGLLENDTIHPYARWEGPYWEVEPIDPWGNAYFMDTDYDLTIGGGDNGNYGVVIGSWGLDGQKFVECRVQNDYQVQRPDGVWCDEDDILIILVGH